MIGRLNHVGIAVPDVDAAAKIYSDSFRAKVSEVMTLPEHGVRVVFVDLPNSRIELMQPLDKNSPLTNFLQRSPAGGMHHICYEVADLAEACTGLIAKGARVLSKPRTGAHGKPVVFLHPKDFSGTLIELEQA